MEDPVEQKPIVPTPGPDLELWSRPAVDPTQAKLPLVNYPPIWAQSRQEVCESFTLFRSYQGGVYHAGGLAKGYLLGGFPSKRDAFLQDGRLIISHGGGKSESVSDSKKQPKGSKKKSDDDQLSQDKSVRALIANHHQRKPIALIIDERYALFPYDIGLKDISYAVLGMYTITHVWAEYQHSSSSSNGRVVRYKFAFQWCPGQGDPWWLTKPKKEDPARELVPVIIHRRCGTCHISSPQIYDPEWVCLNPLCTSFWMSSSRTSFQPVNFHHGFEFTDFEELSDKLPRIGVDEILPAIPKTDSINPTGQSFTRGWHCRDCGRLSCRFKWQFWECSNCRRTLLVPKSTRDAIQFLSQPIPGRMSGSDVRIAPESGITVIPISPAFSPKFTVTGFSFPDEAGGAVYCIRPTSSEGADKIFRAYQDQAFDGQIDFRRWPMRTVSRGQLLTNYFSQNCMCSLTLYVGGTANTIPLQSAPSAIVDAHKLIQTRVSEVLAAPIEFNEILSAAYMENQKMAANILVMAGPNIQLRYEHTVIPTNFRIAATARLIRPNAPRPIVKPIKSEHQFQFQSSAFNTSAFQTLVPWQ
ncbi:hypothetical protein C8J56DRAFT_794470 [Mycena floridula]|nr:hypothetical protein C8J56DRAFT_794470 [Mycena floridula]